MPRLPTRVKSINFFLSVLALRRAILPLTFNTGLFRVQVGVLVAMTNSPLPDITAHWASLSTMCRSCQQSKHLGRYLTEPRNLSDLISHSSKPPPTSSTSSLSPTGSSSSTSPGPTTTDAGQSSKSDSLDSTEKIVTIVVTIIGSICRVQEENIELALCIDHYLGASMLFSHRR